MSAPQGPSAGTIHLPLALVITACAAIVAFSLWVGSLQAEVRALQEWRASTDSNRFTAADGRVLQTLLEREVQAERAYSRSLCNDVTRLYRELDRIPPNDCGRP